MTELAIRPADLRDSVITSGELLAETDLAPLVVGGVATMASQDHQSAGYTPDFMDYETNASFVEEAQQIDTDATVYSLKARASLPVLSDDYDPNITINPVSSECERTSQIASDATNKIHAGTLPPAAPDLTYDYHLTEIAQELAGEETGSREEDEGHALPPFLSSMDAITASSVISNSDIAAKLIEKYGKGVYDSALKKATAIREANIAETYTYSRDVVRQYNRLRQGAEPDDTMPIIPAARIDSLADSVTEPPLCELAKESLVFKFDEGSVVLSALHMAATRRDNRHVRVAALDVLSRYEPSPKLRKLYGNMLKHAADIQPDITKNAPNYSTSSSSAG